jgi:hypothetical protein
MIEREAKPPIDISLNGVLLVAEGSHILPGLDGAELGGRSMFVRAANKKDIVADLSPETRMDIGWKQRACEIAEMFDAVHVRQRTGNENPGHGSDLSRVRMPNPRKSKSPPARRKGLDSAHAWRDKRARYPIRSNSVRSGRGIRVGNSALAKITSVSPVTCAK